jgi:YfiH family protein
VAEVLEPWPDDVRVKADAMVTSEAGIIIGILTADCVPVLLADPEARIIAAVHAGWKGALSGILENTVAEMERLGAQRSSIRAAAGPSIQQTSYEVGPELRESFLGQSASYKTFFLPGKGERFQLDLIGFVEARLIAEGIDVCPSSPLDTYTDDTRFFSYRRSVHRKERDYGRQLSAICMIGQNR